MATNIFDPYIEVDFGRDVLFSSVTTEGIPPRTIIVNDEPMTIPARFIERYRVQVAGEDGQLQYITSLAINSSQPTPTVSIILL